MTLPLEPASPQQDALMSLLRQGDAEGFVTAWAEAGKPFYLEPGTPGCHRTWLGWAAEAGRTRAVKALLKAGADPNERDGSPCAEERPSWMPCPPEPYQFPSPLLLALGKGYQGARETRRRLACCRMLLDAGATETRAKLFSFCWHVVRHKEHDFVDRWLSANGLEGLGTAEDALQTAVGANSFSACWALIRFLSRHLTRDEQDDLESNVLLMAASQGKSAPLRAVVKEGCNEGAWSALGAYVRRKANQYHREAQERTQREQSFGTQRARPTPATLDAPSAYTSRFQHEQHQMETDEALRCLKALSERGAKPALSEQRAMFTHLLEAPQPYCRRFRDHAIGLLQPQEDVGTPDLWARWVRLLAEKGEPQDLKVLLQLGRGLNEEIWPGTTLGAEMLHRLQWLQWTQERGSEWLTALERAGLDMKKTRYKGAALFHAAAIHGSDTVVAWSLRCGAEVNALDENGFSAMAHAFRRGADPALVSPLSCAGADWDWRDGEGNSLLHVYRPRTWGRMGGALSRELLNDHPRLLEARNRNGHTPLDAECVKLAQKAHSRDAYLKAVLLLRLQAPLTIDDNVLDRAFPPGDHGRRRAPFAGTGPVGTGHRFLPGAHRGQRTR